VALLNLSGTLTFGARNGRGARFGGNKLQLALALANSTGYFLRPLTATNRAHTPLATSNDNPVAMAALASSRHSLEAAAAETHFDLLDAPPSRALARRASQHA
jgi:hypothetical protein